MATDTSSPATPARRIQIPRAIAVVVVVVALAFMPWITEVFDQPYYIDVFSRIMILTIGAVSLNFIMGYGGMVSFGHAAYLGIGAYTVGIAGYYDITSGWIQWPVGIAASALFALVTGAISLRTRGVYFIMITLAFTQMIHFLFVSLDEYGGDDGLVIFTRSEFSDLIDLEDGLTLYYTVFVILLLTLFTVHRLINSRFGATIRGAKSNDARMHALGYSTFRYKLTAYVIGGVICGIAGLLLGNQEGFVSPDMMHWTRSGDLIIMVVLGGMGSLWGPVFGAIAFILLEVLLPDLTTYWHLILGPILILVVLFARGGIDSFLGKREEDAG